VKLQPENVNYGLVGYPVLMTADIVLYKATLVPVGEDQLPHLEIAREITRRFNSLFGYTFPEPEGKLTNYPLVVGLDGKEKMSKQAGNDIELALTDEETIKKIKTAYTDPARQYRSDPGNPIKCNVNKLMGYFESSKASDIADKCRKAEIGCVECKLMFATAINRVLKPIRERRRELAADPKYINEILADGANRARVIAKETLIEVKKNMRLI
jgi:tryptophanyl-tRNA synthetase